MQSGITASPLAVPTRTIVSSICPKCGEMKKSGRGSCCARGGAWFKNCGDAGDTQFDHSWSEGIQACENFVSSTAIKSPLQIILLQDFILKDASNTTQTRNYTNQDINIFRPVNMSHAARPDSGDCIGFGDDAIFMCVVLCLQLFYNYKYDFAF